MNLMNVSKTAAKARRPVKVLQYGEGNFLRAFADYMIDVANERGVFDGSVEIVKSTRRGDLDALRAQDCVYTVLLRGLRDGAVCDERRVITCVAGAVAANDEYAEYADFAKNPDLRFVISNTTEAGIVFDADDSFKAEPPRTYPGKLTKLLYERFVAFGGARDKGLIVLPTELIEDNGAALRGICLRYAALWELPAAFADWLGACNTFCNTLVDRIVTGYPEDEAVTLERELGYTDARMTAGEPFALWVIESGNGGDSRDSGNGGNGWDPDAVRREFPLDRAGLPVIFTRDLRPYRERKVRLLNGAHTSSALAAYLCGIDTVGGMMADRLTRTFLERAVYRELLPYVPLPDGELRTPIAPLVDGDGGQPPRVLRPDRGAGADTDSLTAFADAALERFSNPFIRHNLLSIALNSVSKFRARVLPTILETYEATGAPPRLLCFSFAALIAFYSRCDREIRCGGPDTRCGGPDTRSGGHDGSAAAYEIVDEPAVLAFFEDGRGLPAEQLAASALARTDFWGRDLTDMPELVKAVTRGLAAIRERGMRRAMENILSDQWPVTSDQ